MMRLLRFGLFCIVSCLVVISIYPPTTSAAQSGAEIKWQAPRNVSSSPGKTSTDPFLIADPTGKVHLFWAEKMGAVEGNQADTVLYSAWDGVTWRRPVDLFFSPDTGGTPIVAYPHGVLDDTGRIHLFWMAQPNFPNYTLYYSNAPAIKASNAVDWKPEERLVDDLTGTKYSIDVEYRSPGELHVIFARVQQGAAPPEERAISYIKSIDYGVTWSDPVDIFNFNSVEHGGSDTRLVLDDKQGIYTTWTEWDGTGNGLRIWFCRSLDNGVTWEKPIALSERIGNEYERDWAAITLLDEDQIVVMWEGGWRAYRQAQYSFDAGVTWSKPNDTFPWLIGENGFVEFVRDSNGTLYGFIAQRLREGVEMDLSGSSEEGLWYSTWDGEKRWQEPVLANGLNAMINPKVTIFGGNQIMAVWYAPPTYEIITMLGTIQNVPRVVRESWPVVTVTTKNSTPTQSVLLSPQAESVSATTIAPISSGDSTSVNIISSNITLVVGLFASVCVILIAFLIRKFFTNKK